MMPLLFIVVSSPQSVGVVVFVKKLLTSPSKMALSAHEMSIYQNVLKNITPLSLNLLAIKVTNRPEDFNGWCKELVDACTNRINFDLLEPEQLKPLKKLNDLLANGVSVSQLRMATISPWPFYVQFLQDQSQVHAFEERQRLLEYVAQLKTHSLADMSVEDRLTIAGKHTNAHDTMVYKFDVQWFGSTKGAKAFHQVLVDCPAALDKALAHIPFNGDIGKTDYQAFVSDFKAAFDMIDESATLAPATRLLAMRRPDQFVSISSANIAHYSQGLDLSLSGNSDFNGYWAWLEQAVRQTHWWRSSEPECSEELFYWQHRAIMLDLLLFADEQTAKKSNYLRMLNKPVKSSSKSATKRVKRTKETAQELVDRALSDESIEDYIRAQRESIVTQVQAGKPIAEVIALIRKIFG